jgi:hypothetical protein
MGASDQLYSTILKKKKKRKEKGDSLNCTRKSRKNERRKEKKRKKTETKRTKYPSRLFRALSVVVLFCLQLCTGDLKQEFHSNGVVEALLIECGCEGERPLQLLGGGKGMGV